MASISARAAPSTGRSRPAPNSASITTSAPASVRGLRGGKRPGPLFRRERGIAFEPANIAQQHDLDARAAFGQQSRGNETVATVIARPCDNDDPAAGRMARGHRLGHGAAGALHELAAGGTAGNRQPVGVGHFRSGQKLKHAASRITKAAQCEYGLLLPTVGSALPLTR